MLSVGLPLLFAGRADCLWGERHQSAGRLAIRSSRLPRRLLDLSLLSDLFEPSRGAKEARRGNRGASFAHHRSTLPRYRGEGSHHSRSFAPSPGLRGRDCQGAWPGSRPVERHSRRRDAPRHWQARRAGAHSLQARPPHPRRVRENEDSSHRWRGDIGSRPISLSRCAHRALPPRKMGRLRLPEWPETRRHTHWGENPFRRRLLRCPRFRAALPPSDDSAGDHEHTQRGERAELRPSRYRDHGTPVSRTGGNGQHHGNRAQALGPCSHSASRGCSILTSIISARQEAQLLFELAQTLGNSLSLKETLSVVAVRLKELIPHDSIVFFVCQEGILIPEYVHGVDYDLFSSLRIPLGQGLSGWVARNEKPITNGNPAAETLHLGKSSRVTSLQSALCVPLRGRDCVAGVLTLYAREKHCFTKEHLRMLLAASSKLGVSVENALQYEKAQSTASTDFLTGLPNARSICQHLEKELSRVRRTKTPLAVLLCDLNGFKKVNDTFGHLTGNKLLQEIAARFKSSCREYDQVGRLGGDEFVLVLPDVTKDNVAEMEKRLSRAVQEASDSACPEMIVSVSVGSSFYPSDGASGEELLSEADRNMYEVKEKHYSKAESVS